MYEDIKKITTLVLTMVMTFMMVEGASAESYYWTATKTMGTTSPGATAVSIPLYKGTMTFKLENLTGTCGYLAGKVVSNNSNLYYINNYSMCAILSKIGAEQSFKMEFVGDGVYEEYMIFRCTVEHNAGITDVVSASGVLYH